MTSRLPKNDEFETQEPKKNEVRIYWAPAKRYQLANFMEEKQNQMGKVVSREVPLMWENHILQTSDPAKIAYIENCDAFDKLENTGQIKRCKDIAEALLFTSGQAIQKSVKEIKSSVSDGVDY